MKKMFRNLMLVAVAAMGFTACQESIEEAVRPIEPAEVEMTITANVDATRTWIDEENKMVQWSEGDQLKVIENGATYRTTKAATIDANGLAQFTVSFPENTTATEFTYNAIYPAIRLNEDDAEKMDMTKIKVTLPDAQNPTATSFDPTADILVAKQIVTDAQPTELSMQFKRLVALGKMTLTNLPESSTISKVIFTVEDTDAEEQPALAGRNYVDATTGTIVDYGYYGPTSTLTLNYLEPISTRDIYFTCNPFELSAGDKLTVKVICSDFTYTREITLPKALSFIEGDLSKFSVNMESATKETNFVFPDGEYAAIAVVSDKYYALSSEVNSKRLNAVEVEYTPGESLASNNATLKWTIAKTDSGYTFKGSNNQYIAWNSGNYAHTQTEIYYLDITEDAENVGRYVVASKADATRKLQKNTGNAYFAFYASEQSGSLYLVPVVADTTPRFEVTPNEDQTIGADGGEITFTVNTENGAVVTAESSANWLIIDNTFKATASANNTTEERSATITFSAESCDDVIVTVKQSGKSTGGETTKSWVRVTSTDMILSGGTFIIGYEETANSGKLVPMRSDATGAKTTANGFHYSGTGTGTTSNGDTIDMNTITDTSKYEVTISASTIVSGAINIQLPNGNYIGTNNGKNTARLYTTENGNTAYGMSMSTNNVVTLKCAAASSYHTLQYNPSNPRFANYGGKQKNLVLYKKN